jgi:hypothetical protein
MELYADGDLIASGSNWRVTYSATLDRQPSVLAVACKDVGAVGGILLAASNGLRTDASWRCSNAAEEGWTQVYSPVLPRRVGTSPVLPRRVGG